MRRPFPSRHCARVCPHSSIGTVSYGAGSCALFLKPERTPGGLDQTANPLGKSHHCFEVGEHDLRGAERLFTEHGIPFHAPIDWGDHDCLYFLDPDGNLLEIVAYRGR